MENPAGWDPAEKVISDAIRKNQEETNAFGRIGWSLAKDIADALRNAGLLAVTRKVTRFEVVNHSGRRISTSPESPRALVAYDISVSLSLQDDDRTLKVFLGEGS